MSKLTEAVQYIDRHPGYSIKDLNHHLGHGKGYSLGDILDQMRQLGYTIHRPGGPGTKSEIYPPAK